MAHIFRGEPEIDEVRQPEQRPTPRGYGMGLSPAVEVAVEGAIDLVLSTIEELRSDAAYAQE